MPLKITLVSAAPAVIGGIAGYALCLATMFAVQWGHPEFLASLVVTDRSAFFGIQALLAVVVSILGALGFTMFPRMYELVDAKLRECRSRREALAAADSRIARERMYHTITLTTAAIDTEAPGYRTTKTYRSLHASALWWVRNGGLDDIPLLRRLFDQTQDATLRALLWEALRSARAAAPRVVDSI